MAEERIPLVEDSMATVGYVGHLAFGCSHDRLHSNWCLPSCCDGEESEASTSYTQESLSSLEESFCEITTSEAESFCISDEDAERLDWIVEGAYCRSPSKVFCKASREPVEMDSLLLLDKDLIAADEVPEGRSMVVIAS